MKNECWGIIAPNGHIWHRNLRYYRRDALRHFEAMRRRPWRWYYRRGWRCRRVRVAEVPA